MRRNERTRGLFRAPKLLWDAMMKGRYHFVYDQIPFTMNRMSFAKRINLVKAGSNLVYRKLIPLNMPLHMQFELTNYCNLRCPVCPTGVKSVNRKPRNMDVELFQQVIDEVGPYLLTASLWAWGEPLLHPNLKRILAAIRRHDIAILLSTNGQKLDDEDVINALVEEPPTHLIVAVDGLTDETNSKFRVGAKLAPIIAGVRKIAEIKKQRNQTHPILHMRFIVMKHNQHQVADLADFAKENHFDFLTVRTLSIVDARTTETTHQNFIPSQSEFQAYDYQGGARFERKDYICQEPFWFPTVLADGTLVPCEQDYNAQQSLGVINDSVSLKDLWFGRESSKIRKIIRDHPEELSFCRNCPYRDREITDCSIKAHILNNRIDFPNLI
ncbi:MAG: radical SAM protein [Desulfobacteraceae bacterium]|nr:MAG: radical SAM protein [Desulfobacteraceae bacterium]